jgi:hypothetical protein
MLGGTTATTSCASRRVPPHELVDVVGAADRDPAGAERTAFGLGG